MANPYSIQVAVSSPVRGGGTQPAFNFTADRCSMTWSWGLQPATALIDYASIGGQGNPIIPLAQMTIQAGGHTFYGFCLEQTPVFGTDGITLMQQFVDMRELLQWDLVYCAFNIRDSRLVNGQWIRRYKHVLPNNFLSYLWTYTNEPYTAIEILDLLFEAPTVLGPLWNRFYHPNLLYPIYELDFLNGAKLGAAVSQISDRMGTVFTVLGGPFDMLWTVKGVGTLSFPPNSDQRRGPGTTMSKWPTQVTVLGDRSEYQILNQVLIPDWLSSWETFFDVDLFANDIFLNERDVLTGAPYAAYPGDTDGLIGWQLAKARALTITVGEYANLRDARDGAGNAFRDYRKFNSRSRLGMPAALYIRVLVFRAFRPSPGWIFRNVNGHYMDVFSMKIQGRSLAEISHNALTGQMFFSVDVITATNGYAIAQGFNVGSDAFKTLRPEQFQLSNWVSGQAVWQHAEFDVDDSGEGNEFIIFQEPVINSGDFITAVDGWPVLNANPTINAPAVRAALVWAGERFALTQGISGRNDVENIGGLSGQYIGFYDGINPEELAYADGFTATQKGEQFLLPLLNRQFYYQTGGYRVQGSNATQLTSVIDRVTLELSAENGLTETVDFTNERSRNADGNGNLILEPDRDFDRREQLQPLLPGQRDLIVEARQRTTLAEGLRQNHRFSKTLRDAFYDLVGFDARPATTMLLSPGTIQLPVGCPLWRDSTDDLPTSPSTPTSLGEPVFYGVTVLHNAYDNGPVAITTTGVDGVGFCKVKGPVAIGDMVGYNGSDNLTQQYAVGQSCADSMGKPPNPIVGSALDAISDDSTKLIRVNMDPQQLTQVGVCVSGMDKNMLVGHGSQPY